MREILFRGKNVCDGDWIYGYYIGPAGRDTSHEICDISDAVGARLDVDPETVGQYTGLKDKNGQRIFEGDILRGAWNTKLVVFYDDISTSYKVKTSAGMEKEFSYYGLDRIEVIGNIHDNGELIHEK